MRQMAPEMSLKHQQVPDARDAAGQSFLHFAIFVFAFEALEVTLSANKKSRGFMLLSVMDKRTGCVSGH